MRGKFRIYKDDEDPQCGPWFLDYPDCFSDTQAGITAGTFEEARRAVVKAIYRWCPNCDKGAVVDTDWGWECTNCGTYDVADGCVKP